MFEYFLSPSGRIGRAKWWLGQLIIIFVVGLCVWQLVVVFQDKTIVGAEKGIVGATGAIWLFVIWFNFCTAAKRYHDRNKSAWWFLFQFVPLVGPIWALIELGFLGGDLSENDFGPGPSINIDEDIQAMLGKGQSPMTAKSMGPALTRRPQVPYQANGGKPAFGRRT
jgi:uncharacterized membrane protein YhaH (DUF805 family)